MRQPGTEKENRPVLEDKKDEPTMADMEESMEGKISNDQIQTVD